MSRTPPGHETSDANPRSLLIVIIALPICGALIFAIVWATLHHLESQQASEWPAPPSLAASRQPPSEPELQPSPSHPNLPEQDMAALRLHWQTRLNQYAWVDRDANVARIPLARAEDILMEHGLPAVLPATQPSRGAP